MKLRRVFTATVLVAVVCGGGRQAIALSPNDAPTLPAPKSGSVKFVTNVQQLHQAVDNLKSNTTIVLSKGVYQLKRPLHVNGKSGVAIRGRTGRFEDVVIRGAGMNNKAVHHAIYATNSDGLTIADVTIGWVGYHPVMLQPNNRNFRAYHCRLIDAGEQFIKASSDGKGHGVDNGRVEYCIMEYTDQGPPNGYTNGVDVHTGKNWEIRHCLFRNIRSPPGAKYKSVPAVLMWSGSKDTICEGNTFINCDRAIAFGLIKGSGYKDHVGGIIRNNFIYVARGAVKYVDAGIYVVSPGVKVLHNTVIINGGYPNAIEARWEPAEITNNLTDGYIAPWDGAKTTRSGNVTNASIALFHNPAAGNLHLVKPVDAVPTLPDCPADWDNNPRSTSQTTPGADQPSASR